MDVQGSLDGKHMALLLYDLYIKKFTGVVNLGRGDVKKQIFFENGQVKFATSSVPEERIGRILCNLGKIKPDQLEYALGAAKKQGENRLGKVLVDSGFLKPHDLLHALREQIKEIVVETFTWTNGEYKCAQSTERAGETVKLSTNIAQIILDGSKRISDPMLLLRNIGTMDTAVKLSRDINRMIKEFSPTEKENRIIELAGQGISLKDLCNMLPYPAIETCQIVFALLAFGVLVKE